MQITVSGRCQHPVAPTCLHIYSVFYHNINTMQPTRITGVTYRMLFDNILYGQQTLSPEEILWGLGGGFFFIKDYL